MAVAVQHLRARALPAALFDRYLPDGVLADNGWVSWGPAWDSRRLQQGSGYHNAQRVSRGDEYRDLLTAQARGDRTVLSEIEFNQLRDELNTILAQLYPSDFPRYYNARGAATSLAYQGAVFSPIPDPGSVRDPVEGSTPTFDAQLELETYVGLANRAGLAFYANVGMANVPWLMTGYLEFNKRYSQETRLNTPSQPGAQLVSQAHWQISPGPMGRARYVATDPYPTTFPLPILKTYPHFLYDPTHPEVVRLCMAHVRDFARRHIGVKGLFLRGEGAAKSFAPHNVAGFQRYMEALLGNPSLLLGRWGIGGIVRFDQIDVRGAHWNARVERDYDAYVHMMAREVGVLHYVEAKRARAQGWYSILGFGPGGIERSALDADFASSGGWFAEDYKYFEGPQKNGQALGADAARLSGKPMAFAISGPPFGVLNPPEPQTQPWPSFRKCARRIDIDHVRLYFRECLTASISHIGYVKAFGHGLIGHGPSLDAVETGIREIRQLRDRALEFMGPFQRTAIQVDDLDLLLDPTDGLGNPLPVDDASGYFGLAMSRLMRRAQIPNAVFSDRSLLRSRTYSRWLLRRSLVFVSFPVAWLETAIEWARFMDGRAPGAAFVVVPAPIESQLRALLQGQGGDLRVVLNLAFGAETATLSQIRPVASTATRAYLFSFRTPRSGEALRAYCDACAVLVAHAYASLDALAGNGVVRPASAVPFPGSELYTNCVTDGLNALLAVSWTARSGAGPQTLTIDVDPRWRARFDPSVVRGFTVSFFGTGRTIAPRQTRYVHVEADLSASVEAAIRAGGMTALIGRLNTILSELGRNGFAVEHGRALLLKAAASLLRAQHARALAGLAALSRMVFLRATRSAGTVLVDAWMAWDAARGAVAAPVANGEAHLVLRFNGHEAQPPVTLAPGNQGRVTLPIRAPQIRRWDFDGSRYHQPTADPNVPGALEVHVTDSDTGGHGFIVPEYAPR